MFEVRDKLREGDITTHVEVNRMEHLLRLLGSFELLQKANLVKHASELSEVDSVALVYVYCLEKGFDRLPLFS